MSQYKCRETGGGRGGSIWLSTACSEVFLQLFNGGATSNNLNCRQFSLKSFIIDLWLGPKYASELALLVFNQTHVMTSFNIIYLIHDNKQLNPCFDDCNGKQSTKGQEKSIHPSEE